MCQIILCADKPAIQFDLECWPFIPEESRLWKLETVGELWPIGHETGLDCLLDNCLEEYIKMWAHDLCTVYFTLATFVVPTKHTWSDALSILDMLKTYKFKASPLLNGPENLEDSALETFKILKEMW